jgi:hypothetical protein
VKGDTPQVGPVWQLSYEELFDETTRPSDEERKEMILKIKTEIECVLKLRIKPH